VSVFLLNLIDKTNNTGITINFHDLAMLKLYCDVLDTADTRFAILSQ
ncbi:uncharacterized protein METZ01_LOCUS424864, partial [marine metagenome]